MATLTCLQASYSWIMKNKNVVVQEIHKNVKGCTDYAKLKIKVQRRNKC